jgi:nucleotide-binding universal stress UspA family protein
MTAPQAQPQPESGGAVPTTRTPVTGTTFVVALDGSPGSLRALDLAVDTAARTGCDIVAAYIVKRVNVAGEVVGANAAMEEATDEVIAELRQTLVAHTAGLDVRARLEVRRGSVLNELVNLADSLDTRGVLLGASAHRLIGALAPKVVHAGHWPVTVVP